MSEDDDENDYSRKGNTSPEYKPRRAKRNGLTPRGIGSEKIIIEFEPDDEFWAASPEEDDMSNDRRRHDDDRPLAIRTGDPEVDADSEAKGYRLVTESELKGPVDASVEKMNDPDTRTNETFIKTGDPEVDAYFSQFGEMISQEDWEKAKADEIAKARQQSRDKDRGKGR
ncbi:hypothetical protein [Pseudaestuariivita rosea]|uniref:hypothetical protein n=1 Tax=Pseudaestuariivita rosea TaxID=2763263 RepID=UPI001ABB998D|nr:hypothetical protein [Pseudaestuariivita rosea]